MKQVNNNINFTQSYKIRRVKYMILEHFLWSPAPKNQDLSTTPYEITHQNEQYFSLVGQEVEGKMLLNNFEMNKKVEK